MQPHQITIHIRLAAKAQRILNKLGILHTIDLASAAQEDCCVFNIEIPQADIETLEFFLKSPINGTYIRKMLAAWQADSYIHLQRENAKLKEQLQVIKNAAQDFFQRLGKYFQERNNEIKKRLDDMEQKHKTSKWKNLHVKVPSEKRKR